MKKQLGKDTLDFQLQKDVWVFRQEFYEAESDEDFAKLSKEAQAIVDKYKDTPVYQFASDIVLANVKDIDSRWRERQAEKKMDDIINDDIEKE